MSRLSVVLGVLLLLGTVGVVFREMDRSRDKPDASKDQDIATRKMLQREIDGVKEKLKVLGEENKRLKLQNSELNLRKQELQVCRDNLKQARKLRKDCDKWAISVDDEKEQKRREVKDAKKSLEKEQQKSQELERQVQQINAQLSNTKNTLEKIEKQKARAEADYEKRKEQAEKLEKALEKAKKAGHEKAQDAIEGQLESLNKDLRQKSNAIEELTMQKKASDRMLRRLEGKLMEAGVDPAEIERQTREERAPSAPKMANPAAAAMMQVGQGTDRKGTMLSGMADIVFGLADDNGDLSIDFEEFVRHVRPTLHEEAKAKPNWRYWLKQKFKQIDRDNSNYITKQEAARPDGARYLVQFLVSKDEMSVLNGTKTLDELEVAPAKNKTATQKGGWMQQQNHDDMPSRAGLLKKRKGLGFGKKGLLPLGEQVSEFFKKTDRKSVV